MDVAVHSFPRAKIRGCSSSLSPPFFHSKASLLPHNSISWRSPKVLYTQLNGVRIKVSRQKSLGALHATSENESISSDSGVEDRWLLVPVGDGDSRQLGYKAQMPGAFEIASVSSNVFL
uniref:Uncharacterized protein n=1 Tax=Rhizophora mucronata TaxID=61149 RepID=A0A2P2JLF8_RHIMU